MRKIYTLCFFLMSCMILSAQQDLKGLKIYINPGHGGYDGDDRNVAIYPFKGGDHNGFWESVANLDKGIYLRDYLEAQGATVYMSRVTNTSADDLWLGDISEMANANNVDLFYSIHSNAHNGWVNYPLMLFKGYDDQPKKPEDKVMADINWDNFYNQKITTWSYHNKNSRGDWSFYGHTSGLGVLRDLTVHGFLSEGSFHDYIPETYRLMSPRYKKHEAWMFMKTIYDYFEKGGMKTGGIAGDIRDSRNKLEVSYYILPGRDQLLPIDKATITLLPNNISFQTDTLYNGVYFFDLLPPGNYQLKVEAEGYYPKTVDVVVDKHKVTYENIALDMVRSTPPVVEKYSPNVSEQDVVNCADPIILEFNWDMDEESVINAFSITPAVEGEIKFEDSQHRFVFTPNKPLEVSTKYTVKLDKSAKHPGDLYLADDHVFSFTTDSRNRLILLASYPQDGDQNVYTDGEFRFVFDKRLNVYGLSDQIKVMDKDGNVLDRNSRSGSDNSIANPYGSSYFNMVNKLNENAVYTVELAGGIKDVTGISLVEPIKYNFATKDQKVTNKTVVDDFEGAASYIYAASESSGVSKGSSARSTSSKLFDKSSHTLVYTFSDKEGHATYKLATPSQEVEKGKVMGLHIYGDFSDNDLYLTFEDANSIQYEAKLRTLDFAGWKFAEVELTDLPADKVTKFTGFKIKGTNSILTNGGTVYLDNLLIYDEVSGIEEDADIKEIRIYPNPASDFVMVNLLNPTDLIALDLYAFDGKRVKTSSSNELIINDLSVGTYILRVVTVKGTKSYPIIISR